MTTSSAQTASTEFPTGLSPAQLLYPDLGQELASTRRVLERVPDGQSAWKPHAKSMSLAALATHLAELPAFGKTIMTTSELDWAVTPFSKLTLETTAERLALFDGLVGDLTALVERADWSSIQESWTLRAGPQVYVNGIKANLLRSFVLSHMSHHRAQLGVYLRLLGVAVPGTYGPTADEM